MRHSFRLTTGVAAAFALAGVLAGVAAADPRPTIPYRGVATQCLDTLGTPQPPLCQTIGSASRLREQPDTCICGGGAVREVSVPFCQPGEVSAPDSLDANLARLAAAQAGTLMTARFEGRRFCAQPGRTGRSGP